MFAEPRFRKRPISDVATHTIYAGLVFAPDAERRSRDISLAISEPRNVRSLS
jgi:hypothetical protein